MAVGSDRCGRAVGESGNDTEEEVPWSGLAEVGPQGAVIPDLV